jgi:hypothetical protein
MTPDDVRHMALELPHAAEMIHRRAPSFRVNMRIFCLMPPGEPRITVKLERDDQLNMMEGHPLSRRPSSTPITAGPMSGWIRSMNT